MPLVQQSTTNKNYQALGMDEVARDIENIIEQVNTNTEDIANMSGGSEYTETIVNISSSEILAMGTTPIELLPAAGTGKYYDIDKIILEVSDADYTDGTYTNIIIQDNDQYTKVFVGKFIFSEGVPTCGVYSFRVNSSDNFSTSGYTILNQSIELTTDDGSSPTLGTGTLRVKIYHKTITFGA